MGLVCWPGDPAAKQRTAREAAVSTTRARPMPQVEERLPPKEDVANNETESPRLSVVAVVDCNGRPVEGAVVIAQKCGGGTLEFDSDNTVVGTDSTDPEGLAHFDDVAATHVLFCGLRGYLLCASYPDRALHIHPRRHQDRQSSAAFFTVQN